MSDKYGWRPSMESLDESRLRKNSVPANEELISAASLMFDVLLSVREFLDDQFDVVDGANGQPLPNEAMRLAQEIDEAIALVRGITK